jgi:hypothetical protein
MQRYTDYVQDQYGNAVPGAMVRVLLSGTSANAPLYSDSEGLIPLTNPVTVNSLGQFWFYAADGRYDLLVSATNVPPQTISDILLEDVFTPQVEAVAVGPFDVQSFNDYLWTPVANALLSFTNLAEGHGGCIMLDNGGGHTITLAANVLAIDLTAEILTGAGKYWLTFWCYDGTNVSLAWGGPLVT